MSGPGGRRETWAALALLFLGVVCVFAEGFAGAVPTMRDFVGFTFPSRAVWRDTITSGDFSAWNPLAELGLPRLAAPVHGTFYPGNVLLLVGSIETGVVLTWLAHAAWAALGGYALARARGLRPVTAVLSGAVWAVGGYAVSMWWNGEKVLTTAWLPWFAVAVQHAVRREAWFSTATIGVAASAAMIVYAGDPFLLFDAAGLALAVFLASDLERPRALRAALRVATFTLVGLALAAPAIVPALLLRNDTARAESLTARAAEAWSLHPLRLAEFFVPGWFGSPFDVENYPGGAFADDPTVQALPWAVSMYAGAAALVFAPFARGRRTALGLGGVGALFLLLALGRHTPLNDLARHIVPGLALLRYPEKHAVVATGLLGLLAAHGFERVLAERVEAWRLAPGALVAVGFAALVAPAPLRAFAHAGALHAATVTVLLVLATYAAHRRAMFSWLVALVAVADLAIAARPFLHWAPRPFFESPFASALRGRSSKAPARLYRPRAGDFETAATLPDGAAQVLGIAATPGHDPARSVRVDVVRKALEDDPFHFADLFALDAVLLPTTKTMWFPAQVKTGDWSLYLLPEKPRAWVAGSVRVLETEAALRQLLWPAFDPYSVAVVTTPDDRELGDLASQEPRDAGECSIVVYRRGRLELACEARTAGFVVVSELDADGWRASVDGEERAIYTTDLVLRGLPIAAGRHRVSFRYETPGLVEGAGIGSLALLGLLLGWVTSRRPPGASTAT